MEIHKNIKYLIDAEMKNMSWKETDTFFSMKQLEIDNRGRVGEMLLENVFKYLEMNVGYDRDKTGDYDIVVDGYKIEVKTATLDKKKKFQHEGIKHSDKWDLICFVDLSPNDLYITFIPRNAFSFNVKIFKYNKKEKKDIEKTIGKLKWKEIEQNIHCRSNDGTTKKATGAGYKVDFKIKELFKINNINDIKILFNECTNIIKKNN